MQKLTQILKLAKVYQLYQWLVGAHKYTRLFARQYIRYQDRQKILDIGCGPADILKYLPPNVAYTGIDLSEDYIRDARKQYPDMHFVCANITDNDLTLKDEPFDTIFCIGVQHHLNDSEMEEMLHFAWSRLKSGGRWLSLEPVRTPQQGRIEKWFMDNDRGKYIRTAEGYKAIYDRVFEGTKQTILTKTMNIPFTIIITEVVKP